MSRARVEAFFEALWQDYVSIAPRAEAVRALFAAENPDLANDHVAFRTFDRDPIAIERLEPRLFDLGYRRLAPYRFEEKQLDAWAYVAPDPTWPRIFLSALRTGSLSAPARAIVDRLLAQAARRARDEPSRFATESILHAGRLWDMPSWDDYQTLLAESEYAAWLAVFGLRANHFTISVNSLRSPATLEAVVERVEAAGHPLNRAGGTLKGSPAERLEQASTLADRIELRFDEGEVHAVPSCYYEFARRYPDRDGRLYQGFVAASADRIFESTDAGAPPRPEKGRR
ncbi:MAG: DUF1338 domain-containing protein [Myxococcota bacterium]